MTAAEKVQIFDTTLRDGEQSPGATMNTGEKVLMARQLERLGVDVIEAGFAASSPGDFEAVKRVAEAVKRPIVLSLARTRPKDIENALKSVANARRPGIHIFIATSKLHMRKKLGMSPNEVLDAACRAVEFAGRFIDYIEFSAEDASRSDPDYLVQVFGEVIKAGATTLNVPDTTGYAVPEEFGALFRYLISHTPGGQRVCWSAHCHNDLGLAVANSLSAVKNGARQIECTINGIGERAGNCSSEEVVMAMKTRRDFFGLATNIATREIYPTSRLLSHITGLTVPINKPIVGDNAFAHEAGIHQDGVLKEKRTYEIMRPRDVGMASNKLVMGKHSGRSGFVDRLKTLGLLRPDVDIDKAFARFKELADLKKSIYEDDLRVLVAKLVLETQERYELVRVAPSAVINLSDKQHRRHHLTRARATVTIRVDGKPKTLKAEGDGMVDACALAIGKLTGHPFKLERYGGSKMTGGAEAQGQISCRIRVGEMSMDGHGVHTDVVTASALAFVNALNRLEMWDRYRQRNGGV